MRDYKTNLTLAPASMTLKLREVRPNPAAARSFNWSYLFANGTSLRGQVDGELDRDGNTMLNPVSLRADYLDRDNQTVVLSWRDSDFACFEASVDGSKTLIVASNDNFVKNSMSLVSSKKRQRAQVTNWWQLTGEPFDSAAWSLTPSPSSVTSPESPMELKLTFSGFFPFVVASMNFYLPNSQSICRWTFFPVFPFYPFIQLTRTASS